MKNIPFTACKTSEVAGWLLWETKFWAKMSLDLNQKGSSYKDKVVENPAILFCSLLDYNLICCVHNSSLLSTHSNNIFVIISFKLILYILTDVELCLSGSLEIRKYLAQNLDLLQIMFLKWFPMKIYNKTTALVTGEATYSPKITWGTRER